MMKKISQFYIFALCSSTLFFIPAMEKQGNDTACSLACLPTDILQKILLPSHLALTQIAQANIDILKKEIINFFAYKRVNTHFYATCIFPWLDWSVKKKNDLLREVTWLMTRLTYNECSHLEYSLVSFRDVSFGYKKYYSIALALIYSGAHPDTTDHASTTCLSKALYAHDKVSVEMLLEYGADPYQNSVDECWLVMSRKYSMLKFIVDAEMCIPYKNGSALCFRSPTTAMAELFISKLDKKILLTESISKWALTEMRHHYFTPELIHFWFNYGLSPLYTWNGDFSIFHQFIEYYKDVEISIEDFLKKVTILLDRVSSIINMQDHLKRTPLDLIMHYIDIGFFKMRPDCQKVIKLLRSYGGKTSEELRHGHIQKRCIMT
jgi:hypothetical protein